MKEQAWISKATDSVILRLAQAEDQDALNKLVELYGPLVRYWLRKDGLRNDVCSDIFQEVFLSVSKSLKSFKRTEQGHTFRGWLRTITRNKKTDYFRKSQKQPNALGGTDAQILFSEIPEHDSPGDDEQSQEEEVGLLTRQALEMTKKHFTEQSWVAFWRTAVDGVETNSVADELGMKSAAVRKAKSRVLEKLKKDFGVLLE